MCISGRNDKSPKHRTSRDAEEGLVAIATHAEFLRMVSLQLPWGAPPAFKHMSLVESYHVSIVSTNGGEGAPPPPQPPAFKHMSLLVKHMSLFETYHESIVSTNGGGLRPPPNPPAFKHMSLVEAYHASGVYKWGG